MRVKNLIVSCLFCVILVLGLFCIITVAAEPDYTKTPVIFVHGHGMTAGCWNPMISYLIKSGYPREYLKAIQLYPNTGSNIEAAERQITPAIEEFLNSINAFRNKEHGTHQLAMKIDIISHSMGALSARWYAAKVRPDRVRKWISLGGAHHGSDKLCAWSDPGARDLCPAFAKNDRESRIQYILNGRPHVPDIDETPFGIGKDSLGTVTIPPDERRAIIYVSIRTTPDKWIKPEESAILDGAGGISLQIPKGLAAKETSEGNILLTNKIGHDEMLSDRVTMELVKTILALQN